MEDQEVRGSVPIQSALRVKIIWRHSKRQSHLPASSMPLHHTRLRGTPSHSDTEPEVIPSVASKSLSDTKLSTLPSRCKSPSISFCHTSRFVPPLLRRQTTLNDASAQRAAKSIRKLGWAENSLIYLSSFLCASNLIEVHNHM